MSNTIVQNAGNIVNKIGFQLQKNSPKIFMGFGIVGVGVTTVLACKATLKVNDILEESKGQVEAVHEALEREDIPEEEYSQEDSKKDLALIYVQTGIKLAKLYAPAIACGILSVASLLYSHNILSKRNVALAAAYATVDHSFKDYRKRVVERFGEHIDKELKYNLRSEKIETKELDEKTGKEKKVKKEIWVANPSEVSEYARYFEQFTKDEDGNVVPNTCWKNDNECNLAFLKAQERYANDLLRTKGRVFLNEVYEILGLPRTKAGQIVGWRYDENAAYGDNYIDFGLYLDSYSYSDYVNGYEPCILLDFNVDGNVWDNMKLS